MGVPQRVIDQIVVLGKTFKRKTDTVPDLVAFYAEKTLSPAKNGTLTTRTSNTVGTLTMAAGHGITTGARLDLYWNGGMRVGILVGTVSVNSVPFTVGAGDNLPVASTVITAMVPTSETLVFTGDDLNALFADAPAGTDAAIVLTQSDDTLIANLKVDSDFGAYIWHSASGVTNPAAGATNGKVYFSHGDSTGSRTVRAGGTRS